MNKRNGLLLRLGILHERIEMTNGDDHPIAEVNLTRIGVDAGRAGHRGRRPARRAMQPLPRHAELIRLLPFGTRSQREEEQERQRSNPHLRIVEPG